MTICALAHPQAQPPLPSGDNYSDAERAKAQNAKQCIQLLTSITKPHWRYMDLALRLICNSHDLHWLGIQTDIEIEACKI